MRGLLLASITLLVSIAPAAQSSAAEAKVFAIEINKLAFAAAPSDLHVNDIIEWKNADIFEHTATARDGSFDVDLPAGGVGRTVLKKAGTIDYFCKFHPGMKGRLTIAP